MRVTEKLGASDLVVAISEPGFLTRRGATHLRVTTSGWAELTADGRRIERRLSASAIADLVGTLARLPAQCEVTVVDDAPQRTLEFFDGDAPRRVVLLGGPWDDDYPGRAVVEELWIQLHDLVKVDDRSGV